MMPPKPLAPIVLFVYNRRDHTKRTVEALARNELAKDSDLFIFSDAPKTDRETEKVIEVRKYLKTISGFRNIKIIERTENWGLTRSITSGVTELVNQFGRIIVLEDDLVTSSVFLRYMNTALDLYETSTEVASIHGYTYPVTGLPATFFLKGADCWGWATWRRAWNLYETDGKKLLKKLKEQKLTKEFDFFGSYPYTMMLENQIMGINHSWAIRWYASCFLAGKLTLYPGESLVRNIGMDASGTNSQDTDFYDSKLSARLPDLTPPAIRENTDAKKKIAAYLKKSGLNSFWKRFKFEIKKRLK